MEGEYGRPRGLHGGKCWRFDAADNVLGVLDASLDLDVVIDTEVYAEADLTKVIDVFLGLQVARALQLSHDPFCDNSNTLIGELGVATAIDGAMSWPLPLLETLRVMSLSLEMEKLLEVIRARLEAGVVPPSKLKSLELAGDFQSHFIELESILREWVISCCEPESGP